MKQAEELQCGGAGDRRMDGLYMMLRLPSARFSVQSYEVVPSAEYLAFQVAG
jgi:hypothetical protein